MGLLLEPLGNICALLTMPELAIGLIQEPSGERGPGASQRLMYSTGVIWNADETASENCGFRHRFLIKP
jgi:hypothetical protein